MTQSSEVAGTVNRLELSGRIISRGFVPKVFASGAQQISATLACPKGRNGQQAFTIEVVVWFNQNNSALIDYAMTKAQGDDLVAVGKLSIRYSRGVHYVSCDCTNGELT